MRRRVWMWMLAMLLMGGGALVERGALARSSAFAADSPWEMDADRNAFRIDRFTLRYLRDHPSLTELQTLMNWPIVLGQADDAYIKPHPDFPTVETSLAEIAETSTASYLPSAVQHVMDSLAARLKGDDLLGFYVGPDPLELGVDPANQVTAMYARTSIPLIVQAGVVSEVRTLASGDRFGAETRENHPAHRRIRDRSPFRANPDAPDGERADLLRRQALDEYIYRLSRHPGRRVDVAISPSMEADAVTLDYLVTENRPWLMYGQVSNTGTRQTNRLRERFGFVHNQLTNNDDILIVDYLTSNFDSSNLMVASYEAPFAGTDLWRYRVSGHWSEYTASDVGFADERFTGEAYRIAGEVIYNFYQHEQLFIDAVAGVRYDHIEVENEFVRISGSEDLITPYVGVRLERRTETATTLAKAMLEVQANDVDARELQDLGRLDPDENYVVMRWEATHSFFMEPLFTPQAFDPAARAQNPNTDATLAHELSIAFRGQYAFDTRLIPQEEQVVGGFYSVRGYPESAVAGDTVLIESLEYRFHVPRSFSVQPAPGKLFGRDFRWAPQQAYGRPDWDLIFRGFIDAGQTIISEPFSFESDESLLGAGVGVELQLRRNLNLRLDWGFALEDLESHGVSSGSNRLHFVATLLF